MIRADYLRDELAKYLDARKHAVGFEGDLYLIKGIAKLDSGFLVPHTSLEVVERAFMKAERSY